MLKFYDARGFPNPDRIRIALAEKGALDDFEITQLDLWKKEHLKKAFKKINPHASIPLIILEDGRAISETTAITEYIDQKFEGISLTGTTPEEKASIHMMQRRAEQKVVDAIGTYFHHDTVGFAPQTKLSQNTSWGRALLQKTLDGMAYFNDILRQNKFIAGSSFSIADITVFTGINFSEAFPRVMVPSSYNHLLAWRERMFERPSCADSRDQFLLASQSNQTPYSSPEIKISN